VVRRHAVTRVCLCVRRLHAALVSAAKVMRCIQCSVVVVVVVVVVVGGVGVVVVGGGGGCRDEPVWQCLYG